MYGKSQSGQTNAKTNTPLSNKLSYGHFLKQEIIKELKGKLTGIWILGFPVFGIYFTTLGNLKGIKSMQTIGIILLSAFFVTLLIRSIVRGCDAFKAYQFQGDPLIDHSPNNQRRHV